MAERFCYTKNRKTHLLKRTVCNKVQKENERNIHLYLKEKYKRDSKETKKEKEMPKNSIIVLP